MAGRDPLGSQEPLQQSRLGRLCLAFLEGDEVLATSVLAEIETDERGTAIAYGGLVTAMAEGLVNHWLNGEVTPAELAQQIRRQLAALEVSHG